MLFSAPFLVCRKDWFWTCHDYSPHLLGYIFQTHLSCWKTNAKTFFSPYPRSSRKPAIIRVKWKHSAEFMHGNGEKWLSQPKTHTFKENSFFPLNQRNATIKELQARFLSYNAVCVRTHIISCWTVSISPNHFFFFFGCNEKTNLEACIKPPSPRASMHHTQIGLCIESLGSQWWRTPFLFSVSHHPGPNVC